MLQIDSRQLGASTITVPALGVGVWSWGDKNFWNYGQSHTREDINQAYKACLDAGLNFFDTAEIYGSGESERILGECVRSDGRPAIIASKFAPLPIRLSARTLLDALDKSLERRPAIIASKFAPLLYVSRHAHYWMRWTKAWNVWE